MYKCDFLFHFLCFVICFQDAVMLDVFGTVCRGLGRRTKPYFIQICGTVLWRLNNKSAKVRQQATDLVIIFVLALK